MSNTNAMILNGIKIKSVRPVICFCILTTSMIFDREQLLISDIFHQFVEIEPIILPTTFNKFSFW